MTRALLWWALLVVPLTIVLVLCTRWEPVMRDGWGHVAWHHDHAIDLRAIYDFARGSYLYGNPRFGQIPTWLLYSSGPWHAIVTPLLELATLALLTTAALGRWPSLRRTGDVLAAALVTAIVAACVRQLGPMLFYRPYTWNYVFGLAVNLWWFMPYRLELAQPQPVRRHLALPLFVLGVAAGLCNEHTGLAFAAMAALATVVAWRRGGLRPWMIAGLVGLIAGYVVLLTAPAQHVRYGAIAEQDGVLERIADRGVAGNLRVLGVLALALGPALPLVAIGLAQPRARVRGAPAAADARSPIVLVLGGLACTVILLASPKLGPRLYFASVAMIAAGLTGWLVGRLTAAWARCCAVLAAGVLVFVGVRLVAIHRVAGPIGAVRRERIERGPPGAAVTVPRLPFGRSRYFLGDDLLDPDMLDRITRQFHLGAVALEPPDP